VVETKVFVLEEAELREDGNFFFSAFVEAVLSLPCMCMEHHACGCALTQIQHQPQLLLTQALDFLQCPSTPLCMKNRENFKGN
jgi:hypothetical protein